MKWKGVMYGKGEMCVRRLGERFAPSADTRCPLPIMGKEHKYSKDQKRGMVRVLRRRKFGHL